MSTEGFQGPQRGGDREAELTSGILILLRVCYFPSPSSRKPLGAEGGALSPSPCGASWGGPFPSMSLCSY